MGAVQSRILLVIPFFLQFLPGPSRLPSDRLPSCLFRLSPRPVELPPLYFSAFWGQVDFKRSLTVFLPSSFALSCPMLSLRANFVSWWRPRPWDFFFLSRSWMAVGSDSFGFFRFCEVTPGLARRKLLSGSLFCLFSLVRRGPVCALFFPDLPVSCKVFTSQIFRPSSPSCAGAWPDAEFRTQFIPECALFLFDTVAFVLFGPQRMRSFLLLVVVSRHDALAAVCLFLSDACWGITFVSSTRGQLTNRAPIFSCFTSNPVQVDSSVRDAWMFPQFAHGQATSLEPVAQFLVVFWDDVFW